MNHHVVFLGLLPRWLFFESVDDGSSLGRRMGTVDVESAAMGLSEHVKPSISPVPRMPYRHKQVVVQSYYFLRK